MLKSMLAKFPGTCAKCGGWFPAGAPIFFNTDTRKATHRLECPAEKLAPPPMPVKEKVAVDVLVAERDALREERDARLAAGDVDEAAKLDEAANALAVLASKPVERFDDVVVVRGRKVPLGTTGTVIWLGDGRFGRRVGVKDAAGDVHWTAASNVEVVAREKLAA